MRRGAVVAALLLAVAPAGRAAAAPDKWAREISGLEERLAKREWKDTLDRAVALRQKMLDRIDEAEELVQPLARSLALQALAEANLGRDDDALWHWQAAGSWLPGLDGKDLSSYGLAREVLAPQPAAATPTAPPPLAGNSPKPSPSGAERYQPVRIRQAVRPVFPASLAKSAKRGKVRVRLVVGADGRPRQPAVLAAGIVPSMAFPVLDALLHWRFDPAADGKRPIAVQYEIEVRYP
jgi:hypothetical protein